MTTIKYHSKFGRVEIVTVDTDVTVVRLEDGTEKRLVTKLAVLSDVPVEVVVASVAAPRISKGEKKRAADRKWIANWNNATYAEKQRRSQIDRDIAFANFAETHFI